MGGTRTTYLPSVGGAVQAAVMAAVVASWGFTFHMGRVMTSSTAKPPNYILAAIPTYFMLMLVEYMLLWRSQYSTAAAKYVLADAWSSITAGMVQRIVIAVFVRFFIDVYFPFYGFKWLHEHMAIAKLHVASPWTYVCGLLCADFSYYWSHRLQHEWAFLWTGHRVHHSSEHYNLSTALRQSWWQGMFGPLFYLPFALVIPPEVYAVTSSVNTVYQFWVHTCLVRRLGPVEWIFSTPAHHRIHHDRRVHKNFGGMLIVWDRMFGTFLDEDECIRAALDKGTLIPETDALAEGNAAPAEVELFGVMKPVSSWLEAVWQHDGWVEFFPRVWRANSLWKCVQAIVKGPGFYTSTMHRVVGPNPDVDVQLRVVSKASLVARGYVLAQFVVTLAFGICFLFSRLTAAGTAAFVALLMSALTTQAMLLNAQSSAWHVESLRCIAFLAFANLFFTSENGLVGLERAIHVVMLLSLLVTCTQITFVHAKQA